MIKQIQRHLAKIDNRLLDPELFYIFVQNYFFLDSQLLDLCLVEPRYQYQKRVSCFLNETILVLMNVKAENLRVILDSICDYKNASINYLYMDFASCNKERPSKRLE